MFEVTSKDNRSKMGHGYAICFGRGPRRICVQIRLLTLLILGTLDEAQKGLCWWLYSFHRSTITYSPLPSRKTSPTNYVLPVVLNVFKCVTPNFCRQQSVLVYLPGTLARNISPPSSWVAVFLPYMSNA